MHGRTTLASCISKKALGAFLLQWGLAWMALWPCAIAICRGSKSQVVRVTHAHLAADVVPGCDVHGPQVLGHQLLQPILLVPEHVDLYGASSRASGVGSLTPNLSS